ncbi:MAG: HAMP domain-containing sensor histidine kinase [Nostoc sp. DedVER02]|uniref:sensor histidine kinase n=1 Tax=unclassified Nostoc TaxID=2593658 RepID=UPI002AD1DDA7|nr:MULTISPECIES: HAMP domain-containing sensor histidine kinase [unclassified Nostoc]MDZ7989350.1 HAMP domain-containing sensor histidine kinase [Nostoc sp. DedVER02]MDZ8114470.1 HAMP domain-containing sensor histidine kinase [Nostoc sp. DedVER01b]
MNTSIANDLLTALDILSLEQINEGLFKIIGNLPDWLNQFNCNKFALGMNILIPQEEFCFLKNFLIDAEEFWLNNNAKKLSSGLWTETDITGQEYHFKAYAIFADNKKVLLIEALEDSYKEKQDILQKAREYKLIYQQLLKDNQKKEVLIHCLIHDIAVELSAINCCFSLLEYEELTTQGKEYLETGIKQCFKQKILIQDILDAFSTEVILPEDSPTDIDDAPNILTSIQEVTEFLKPNFALNHIQLQLDTNIDKTIDWTVIGDQSRLDRVISNLVENAYRHSVADSTVTINLQLDGEYVLVTVDDQGLGVPPEMVKNLFQKFSQGKDKSGRAGLGLYFCRITLERWGGKIGYLPRPEGGSRFWFRLPRAAH